VRPAGVPLIRSSQGKTTIYLEGVGAPPMPSSPRREKKSHDESFGVVYANGPASEGLAKEGRTKFPTGSIIVREKLARPDDTMPELVAVMIKRASGFNPEGGDWEFLTADGMLTKVGARQRKGSCLECHSSQADRDFVFPLP
jgi:hypothetical protein